MDVFVVSGGLFVCFDAEVFRDLIRALGPGVSQSPTWRFISRVISRVTTFITLLRGLITPLITSHEPPSIRFRNQGQSPRT